jgi:asparagine synthase (glutamine-hydrolysing)
MIWDADNPHQAEAEAIMSQTLHDRSGEYAQVLSRAGLCVFTADNQSSLLSHPLKRKSGVVLGSIYERHDDLDDDSPSTRPTFNDCQTDEIVASQGRCLVSKYWGNYVAILAHDPTRSTYVLKDPTGTLPCFVTSWRGMTLAFSCLQDCLDLGVLSFTVNWSYVANRVASNSLDASSSPLSEVRQVRRGECLKLCGAKKLTYQYWLPTTFAQRSDVIDNLEVAVRALRGCVHSATRTLAADHKAILVRLSGGLDSSIVAGCLKDVSRRAAIVAYTYFNPDERSDERRWARLSAGHAGFEHVECIYNPSKASLERALEMAACVEPPQAVANVIRGGMERQLVEQRPYTAVFSGDGGDSSFGAEAIRYTVDDALRLRGFSASLLKLSSDVALRIDSLTWTVFARALRHWARGSRMDDLRDSFILKKSLAARRIRDTALRAECFPHPWFSECRNVPWHVIRRLGSLILTPEFYDPLSPSSAGVPLSIAPLYSQPVVELALRIPIYVHFNDGIDRWLARKAFSTDVPTPILRRLWKDRAPGSFEALAHFNRTLLRDVILGGSLANSGLLDCPAIERIFKGEFSKSNYFLGELFALFDLALWIDRFSRRVTRRTAA